MIYTGEANVKAAVRERDGHKCVDCGMTADEHREIYGRGLSVHRKVPKSKYTIDGCVTVCVPCHMRRHDDLPRTKRRVTGEPRHATPRQFRLSPEELADIDHIARVWGPVEPLTRTQVIREMIRRTKAALESGEKKPKGGKS